LNIFAVDLEILQRFGQQLPSFQKCGLSYSQGTVRPF